MNQTILVDWPLFRSNPYTQDFIVNRIGQAKLVLLVPSPKTDDYEHGELSDPSRTFVVPDIEWDAVIRNSGGLENVAFKATALDVLQTSSSLTPVIALDASNDINEMYRSGGVLITVEDL